MKFVSISSLQKTSKPMLENDVVCVLKNNEPAFYTLSPERYNELLLKEQNAIYLMDQKIKEIAEKLSPKNFGKTRG